MKQEHIDAIRDCATRFHEIMSSLSAEKILAERQQVLTITLYESMCAKVLSAEAVKRRAADGFEALVRVLNDVGAPDVSIHECATLTAD